MSVLMLNVVIICIICFLICYDNWRPLSISTSKGTFILLLLSMDFPHMLDKNCSPHLKLYLHIICIQIVKIMKNSKIFINTLSLGKHKAYPATLRQNSGVKQGSPQAHTKLSLIYLFLWSLLLFVLFILFSFWGLFL